MRMLKFIEKHKGIFTAALVILSVAIIGCAFLVFKVGDSGYRAEYIAFMAVALLFLIGLAVLIKFRKQDIAMITAISLSFFCIVFLFVFPPFTVPDEAVHYETAYHVSNKMMFIRDEQMAMQMRGDDIEYIMNMHHSIYEQEYIKEMNFDRLACQNKELTNSGLGYFEDKDIIYLASASGITLARLVGLGPYWTFQLGRLFNIAQFIIAMYFAIKIIPFGKVALAAISLIPINLHIMSSVSYDVFSASGMMLIFAYIIRLMYYEKKVSWKELIILSAMIALVVPQKVVYIGVAAMVLLVPKENFAKPKLHFALKCAVGVVAAASLLVVQLGNVSNLTSQTIYYTDAVGYSLPYVLENPREFAALIFNTVLEKGDFYVKSIISHFGWFEMEIQWFVAILYIVLLAIAFMRLEDEPAPAKLIEKLYALALFAVVFFATELLLLIAHTPLGSSTIEGVQGRYFIPALPLIYFVLRNNTVTLKKKCEGQIIYAFSALNVVVLFFCISNIAVH